MTTFSIKTNNYIIKYVEHSDLDGLFLLRSDLNVAKAEGRQIDKDKASTLIFLNKMLEGTIQKKWYYFVILNQQNQLIGSISIWNFNKEENSAELGYSVISSWQRKKVMSEVLDAIENYSFNTLKLNKLYAFTNQTNLSSIKLLNKKNYLLINKIVEPNLKNKLVTMLQFVKINNKLF